MFFKILLIATKYVDDMAPEYLCEQVSIKKSSRKLSSSSQILLQVPLSWLKLYGNCSFSVLPPLRGIGCWQILEMRRLLNVLKSVLNTHLFNVAFTDK